MYSGDIDREHWPEMSSLKALFFFLLHNFGNTHSNIPSYYLKTVFAPILSFISMIFRFCSKYCKLLDTINIFPANVPILYALKTADNHGVFRGYKMETLARNVLK